MIEFEKLYFKNRLKILLSEIKKNDTNYNVRYWLVLQALSDAYTLGYKCGFRIDPQEPEWPVAYIELPTGQVSWHMPQHEKMWDGHSTEEKYNRIDTFIKKRGGDD